MVKRDFFAEMKQKAQAFGPQPTAVCVPTSSVALLGALEARDEGFIIPYLVGDAAEIKALAAAEKFDLSGCHIVDVLTHDEAALKCAQMCADGTTKILMKGNIHTGEFLRAALKKEVGLRTARRISHVFALDVPLYNRVLFVTDAAINIAPTLEEKVDIIQNAIDLTAAVGYEAPKVAILSALETVSPNMPSTMDAAMLCKMADRGQIRGGILDGPFALDNVISEEAAHIKGIQSPVAAKADILVVPNIEAGNILAKTMIFLAQAKAAGVVLGAKVPIVLTSRADDAETRLASCFIASILGAQMRRPLSV